MWVNWLQGICRTVVISMKKNSNFIAPVYATSIFKHLVPLFCLVPHFKGYAHTSLHWLKIQKTKKGTRGENLLSSAKCRQLSSASLRLQNGTGLLLIIYICKQPCDLCLKQRSQTMFGLFEPIRGRRNAFESKHQRLSSTGSLVFCAVG